ncbi:hypothetical protein P4493_05870 [Bacillus thuringiensis]|jgi:hypothetical protein|uniref:Uncharacterized protein n=3 Tax=Bacillus thuringiensis TaxID=1428 RepID=A0A0B5NLB9_BACTU|nr:MULTISPECIES: hypothetical protein [Bacillus]EAO55641.1 hypothetical protein RBTH_06777 [Bacillus thuringiensis serovar israelensis ATCC 35646]MEC2533090.1 hypothetical protein [Bacillus cereus]MED1153930.1 hypothetical protein [Bacillus paranthracis]OUB09229.1 hypothetical protein BK708_32355 [Bacillus thuringiensis serovar yunnanensis]AFQ29802.1 hypothetical protein BTF1_28507 [Bacillus thuringiensis HD-789]
MVNLNVGVTTAKGEELKLGDVLSAGGLLDTVVVVDEEGNFHAQVVSEPFIAFELELFIRQNIHVEVTDNIVKRSKKKIFEE